MEHIKTGFIKPDNTFVSFHYYELEAYCQKEIANYVLQDLSESMSRLEHFKKFAKDYTYFNPFLDFVLFEMKYIQVNPFFMKGYFGYTDGEQYYVKKACSGCYQDILGNGAFYFNKATDKNYAIQNKCIIENGFIDVKGNVLTLFSSGNIDMNAWGHPGLSSMVLNQYLSFSKTISDAFEKYSQMDNSNRYTMFLMEKLGFAQVTRRRGHNLIWLNPNLVTKEQMDVAYLIKEYYGNDFLPCTEKESDPSLKKYVKEIWGNVYENR